MKDQLSCSKCSYTGRDNVTRCPQCGSWMPRAQGIRRRGWVLILLGFLLVGMMGTITFMLAPKMLSTTTGSGFTGTPDQAMLILGLFGLVIVFGLTCIGSGVWQIVTGRRSIWIVVLILGLAFLLVLAGGAVYRGLDRGKDVPKVVTPGSIPGL